MQSTIESYINYLKNERGFSPETIVKYSSNLRILFTKMNIYDISQIESTVLNKRLIDDFWTDAQAGIVYSDSTRASYLSALKSFIKFCFIQDLIETDLSEKIRMPKKRILFLEGLSSNEQKRLREYLATNLRTEKDLRNAALIMFLWSTGTRISEALALNCHSDSYIYDHNSSIVSGDFHLDNDNIYVHIKGKGKKDRMIIVSDTAIGYLNLYLDKRKHKNGILFHNIKNPQNDKLRLNRKSAGEIIESIFSECEIKKTKGLRTHKLRHSAINTWIEKGIHPKRIITMTGHANVSGLEIYFHRNKRLTDVFIGKGESLVKLESKESRTFEGLLLRRYIRRHKKCFYICIGK